VEAKKYERFTLIGACAATFALTVAGGLSTANVQGMAQRLSYQSIFVVDGDTLQLPSGERVRLLGIDAPEMSGLAKCDSEASRANAARDRLQSLISHAASIELRAGGANDRDRYGRLLRFLIIDGHDAGETLVSEGLAQPRLGHPARWC
jgi:endonuclease YncB( thermonuclease family)